MNEDDLREYLGLWLAYYQADEHRRDPDSGMARRRRAQQMALTEILHWLDGDKHGKQAERDLRDIGLVPLTLDDLPENVGGRARGLDADINP